MGIIQSILENDLYKFSQTYYYQQMYPEAIGTFTFKDRNNLEYNDEFMVMLQNELIELSEIKLTDEECEWCIENIPYIPRHYWEWLKTFRFDKNKIKIERDKERHLHIEVTDVIYKVSFYEIPILALVSELYYKSIGLIVPNIEEKVINSTRSKIEIAKNSEYGFMEFGMRRRFSRKIEELVCKTLSEESPNCVGTSTVYFAKMFGMKPLGTQAHEIYMFTAAHTSPKDANYLVMENWAKVYDGNLGTVLTDTYTVDEFLRQFSRKLAKLYDGVRHDSGDPFEFGEKIIKKYQSYGIDPMSKTIIFSDSLTFEKCAELKKYFEGRIKLSFGIGTNLTCPMADIIADTDINIKSLNIVMKLTSIQVNPRQPIYGCVKLSDVPSKAVGKQDDINVYRYLIGV